MWGDPQSIFKTLQLVLNWRISKESKHKLMLQKIVLKTIIIHARNRFLDKSAWSSSFHGVISGT